MTQLKEIFINHFIAALSSLGVNDFKAAEYIIVPTDEHERYTSRDEIYRLWVTPAFTGIRISFDSVIDFLVKEDKKVAPLRIKISKKENKPVFLEISQRFRKLRDIAQRKASNLIYPFEILEETELEFTKEIERIEAIRIVFFKRKYSSGLKELLNGEITYEEAIKNFENHFDHYKFYPPSYNQSKEGDESYSSLVINKDFETDDFSLFINPNFEEEKYSKLDFKKAIDIYINEELNHEIYGLQIGKKDGA